MNEINVKIEPNANFELKYLTKKITCPHFYIQFLLK